MSPAQFLARMKRQEMEAAYLFLGAEAYERRKCREALIAASGEAEVAQHDLSEVSLAEVIDDARALSLFAQQRLIFVISAEAALPRTGKAEEEGGDDSGPAPADAGLLASYLKDPSPGVVLVLRRHVSILKARIKRNSSGSPSFT